MIVLLLFWKKLIPRIIRKLQPKRREATKGTKNLLELTAVVEQTQSPNQHVGQNGNNGQDSQKGKKKVKPKFDEVNNYLDCRYISAPEGIWRTLGYEIQYRKPSVERLPFHLEGEQNIYFNDKENLENVIDRTNYLQNSFGTIK